jgi:DNA-binding NtrC family response regulator
MKLGAYHYITKDFEYDAVLSLVRNASDRTDLHRKVMSLSAQVADDRERPFITGSSREMREVLDLVRKVAGLDTTVLILGESGTGKELLARMIHRESARADGPFMPVNLAAIPADLVESALFGHEKGSFTGAVRQQIGKFELADRGTLFLDEIGELRPDVQAKLLRAIQESEIERVGGGHPIRVSLRIIAATNIDLEKAVREGRFREDLYYRVKVIPMQVPPLRERSDDLDALVAFFLGRYNAKFRKHVLGVEPSAMEVLRAYQWPGNVRELENLTERLVAVSEGDWICDEDLPYEFHLAKLVRPDETTEGLFDRACEMFERNFILKALEHERWNVTAAARVLGMPLSTLKFKMERLDIRDIARKLRHYGPA